MNANADLQKLTRRVKSEIRADHPELGPQLVDSLARLAARTAMEWTAEQSATAFKPKSAQAASKDDPPPPAVIGEIERALMSHFPEMPPYAARALAGDVFEQVQEFYSWKVHPFPDQHLLPPFMRRGPAPPWPGDPEAPRGLGFRLVRVSE